MRTFNVTIMAEGSRTISDGTESLEEIKSTFIVHGENVLDASEAAVQQFIERYTTELEGADQGCADLSDFEVIMISIVPHDEGE